MLCTFETHQMYVQITQRQIKTVYRCVQCCYLKTCPVLTNKYILVCYATHVHMWCDQPSNPLVFWMPADPTRSGGAVYFYLMCSFMQLNEQTQTPSNSDGAEQRWAKCKHVCVLKLWYISMCACCLSVRNAYANAISSHGKHVQPGQTFTRIYSN